MSERVERNHLVDYNEKLLWFLAARRWIFPTAKFIGIWLDSSPFRGCSFSSWPIETVPEITVNNCRLKGLPKRVAENWNLVVTIATEAVLGYPFESRWSNDSASIRASLSDNFRHSNYSSYRFLEAATSTTSRLNA